MDKVEQEVEKVKKEWDDTYRNVVKQIKAIENYGKSTTATTSATEIETQKDSLPRMKGLAQDGLSLLNSLQFKLDLFAPQLPTDDQVQSAKALLESWKNRSQRYPFYALFGCRYNYCIPRKIYSYKFTPNCNAF